jgi:signal peptidase I
VPPARHGSGDRTADYRGSIGTVPRTGRRHLSRATASGRLGMKLADDMLDVPLHSAPGHGLLSVDLTRTSAIVPAPTSVELELLRQQSIQVLASVAGALEAAAERRRILVDEIHTAEHTLVGLARERERACAGLIATRTQLNDAAMELNLTRRQQVTLVNEVEELLRAGVAARASMLAEVATLERFRAELAAAGAQVSLPSGAFAPGQSTVSRFAPTPADGPSATGAEVANQDSAQTTSLPLAAGLTSNTVGTANSASEQLASATASVAHLVRRPLSAVDQAHEAGPAGTPIVARSTVLDAPQQALEPALRKDRLDPDLAAVALLFVTTLRSAASDVVRTTRKHLELSSHPTLADLSHVATKLLVVLLIGLALLLTPITALVGGLQLLAVTSASMEPTIPVGAVVGVRPVPAADLKVGDIITFVNPSSPDVLVTHRVVSLDMRDGQTMLTTKGDANDSADALSAPANRAVGRVEFSLAYLGYVMVWMSSPVAKIGIVGLAVLGLGFSSVRRSTPDSQSAVGASLS